MLHGVQPQQSAVTCGTQEAVLLLLPGLADIHDAEEPLIVGREDVPLEGVFDGCHGGCCHRKYIQNTTRGDV